MFLFVAFLLGTVSADYRSRTLHTDSGCTSEPVYSGWSLIDGCTPSCIKITTADLYLKTVCPDEQPTLIAEYKADWYELGTNCGTIEGGESFNLEFCFPHDFWTPDVGTYNTYLFSCIDGDLAMTIYESLDCTGEGNVTLPTYHNTGVCTDTTLRSYLSTFECPQEPEPQPEPESEPEPEPSGEPEPEPEPEPPTADELLDLLFDPDFIARLNDELTAAQRPTVTITGRNNETHEVIFGVNGDPGDEQAYLDFLLQLIADILGVPVERFSAEFVDGSIVVKVHEADSGNVCFHEDTLISYEGSQFGLKQLKSHPNCAIPHIIKSNGVKISTTCKGILRLTDEHLVFTQSGLKPAKAIQTGDSLFFDLEEKTVCQVTNVEIEVAQTYFGLNCENSEVLANGYKTSTFGVNHAVPALWMKFASKIFGIKSASSIGNSIANALASVKLI